jgi:hypothetical protein
MLLQPLVCKRTTPYRDQGHRLPVRRSASGSTAPARTPRGVIGQAMIFAVKAWSPGVSEDVTKPTARTTRPSTETEQPTCLAQSGLCPCRTRSAGDRRWCRQLVELRVVIAYRKFSPPRRSGRGRARPGRGTQDPTGRVRRGDALYFGAFAPCALLRPHPNQRARENGCDPPCARVLGPMCALGGRSSAASCSNPGRPFRWGGSSAAETSRTTRISPVISRAQRATLKTGVL